MTRETLLPRYPNIRASDLNVAAGSRRPGRPHGAPGALEYVHRFLERRGVTVLLRSPVERVEPYCVHVRGGRTIPAFTIIWTAGVHRRSSCARCPCGTTRTGACSSTSPFVRSGRTARPGRRLRAGRLRGLAATRRDDAAGALPDRDRDGRVRGATARAPRRGKAGRDVLVPGRGLHHLARQALVRARAVRNPGVGRIAWLFWAAAYLVKMVGFRSSSRSESTTSPTSSSSTTRPRSSPAEPCCRTKS